jgi:pimeloyl-ACP methyl ester carboxylesterase
MLRESRTMLGTLQKRLPLIQVPVHLAHSRYDLSIPYQEMSKLNEALVNAPQVTTLTLENSGHQIFPRSRDKEKTTLSILEFVDAVCPRAVTV